MTTAYIGIGSNVGDRAAFVRAALAELSASPNVEVVVASSLYETSPVGGPPQRSFVNAVAKVETSLDARGLLGICRAIEERLGREPSTLRWGPRVIDLDVLLFGDHKIGEPDLEVPHPRMHERRFVLVPLLEIQPDVTDPWGNRYADLVEEAAGEVQLYEG